MAEEHSGGKPADFFVGLVDFFAILLPGTILTFWLYKCIEWQGALKDLLPPPPENWMQFAAYAVIAYVLGHLLYVVGSLCLDPLYDWWKESSEPQSLEDLRERAKQTDEARGMEPGLKANQVCLRIWSAGATSEMERLEADQKFFRGLIVVLLLAWPSFLWSWGKCNWPWWGLALLAVPIVIGKISDRWKDRLDEQTEKMESMGEEKKEEEKEKKLKELESKKKHRKDFQLAWFSIVLIGCFLWLVLPLALGPLTLPERKFHREVPAKQGPSASAPAASPMPERSAQTGTSESRDEQSLRGVDKRWVAGLLGLGLLLSAVRFAQQRVKYTEFVYRAYLALHSQGPLGTTPGAGEGPTVVTDNPAAALGQPALLSNASSQRRVYINLPNRPAGLPFSDGVLVGDTLYLSGRIGLDPATGQAPESVDAELSLLFDGFQAVLRQAGMSMDDLVWVQVHSPDVSLWERFNAAYMKFFSREFPARAFLGSGPLLKNGRFEMLGMAVKS